MNHKSSKIVDGETPAERTSLSLATDSQGIGTPKSNNPRNKDPIIKNRCLGSIEDICKVDTPKHFICIDCHHRDINYTLKWIEKKVGEITKEMRVDD